MRSVFIFLGVALINAFSWVFYLFGLILLWTAVKLLKPEKEDEEGDEANNVVIKLARRFIHTSDHYDGDKLFTIVDGKSHDADAVGDGGHRRHRRHVRARHYPRDLRPDPEQLHRLHRRGVLADGPAPAVLPAGTARSTA